MTAPASHKTVLLDEAVEALVTDPAGIYIDGTFGRGGHSRLILQKLDKVGQLLATDKDPGAIATGMALSNTDTRFAIEQGSFTQLPALAVQRDWTGKVAGVLLDLGVSSPQLDEAERGFSFSQDGPLDMRMDPGRGESAAQWLERVEQKELARVLKTYGDEKFARRIAGAIVKERQQGPIERTGQLADIIARAHPAWEVGKHPATRSFLAIRLFINQELEELQHLLASVIELLHPGGRLVVISFHSLEDRIVKRFMRDKARGDQLPRGVPVREEQLNKSKSLKIIGRAVKPSADELEHNVRARSAVMRVAEKLAG